MVRQGDAVPAPINFALASADQFLRNEANRFFRIIKSAGAIRISGRGEGGSSPLPTASAHEEEGIQGTSQRRLDPIRVEEPIEEPK